MPTLVNNLRAIRGPVTAVPVTAGSGIEIAADTQNNQIVISSNLEAGSGIEIVDDNGKAKIINSDNAQALPIVAGTGVKLSVVNNQVVVSADETVLWENESSPLQTTGGTATLSEAASNFKYLRFEYRGEQSAGYGLKTQTIANDNRLDSISLGCLAQFYENYAFSFTCSHVSISGTTLTLVRQGRFNINDNDTISATDHGNNLFRLVRVVGINRIANN